MRKWRRWRLARRANRPAPKENDHGKRKSKSERHHGAAPLPRLGLGWHPARARRYPDDHQFDEAVPVTRRRRRLSPFAQESGAAAKPRRFHVTAEAEDLSMLPSNFKIVDI